MSGFLEPCFVFVMGISICGRKSDMCTCQLEVGSSRFEVFIAFSLIRWHICLSVVREYPYYIIVVHYMHGLLTN